MVALEEQIKRNNLLDDRLQNLINHMCTLKNIISNTTSQLARRLDDKKQTAELRDRQHTCIVALDDIIVRCNTSSDAIAKANRALIETYYCIQGVGRDAANSTLSSAVLGSTAINAASAVVEAVAVGHAIAFATKDSVKENFATIDELAGRYCDNKNLSSWVESPAQISGQLGLALKKAADCWVSTTAAITTCSASTQTAVGDHFVHSSHPDHPAHHLRVLRDAALDPSSTVEHLTSCFSKFSSTSTSICGLYSYFQAKCVYERVTRSYYHDPCFRYFTLQRFINRQRIEMNWVNQLCRRYGKPEKLVVAIGDWCVGPHISNKRGRLSASYRRLIKYMTDARIQVFIVDEAFTSKHCHVCRSDESVCSGDNILENKINPRPHQIRSVEVHGRLLCDRCLAADHHIVLDRDVNASRNIYLLARHILKKKSRPQYLPHSPKLSRNIHRRPRNGIGTEPGD